jgi:hypothetical protein
MAFILFGAMAFSAETPHGETWQAWVTDISGVAFALSAWASYRKSRRKNLYPDLLATVPIAPYECAGVLLVPVFSPTPVRPEGRLRHAFLYQNRFESSTTVELTLEPGPRWHLEIGPGEVCLLWVDGPVPPVAGTGPLKLTLLATGKRGPGREVRFRPGNVLGNRARESFWLLLGLAAGTTVLTKQAELTVPLDPRAADGPGPGPGEGRLTIWRPGFGREETRNPLREAAERAGIRIP